MKTDAKATQQQTLEPLHLRLARRCLARTRTGKPCQSPAVKDKARCRMHGGAKGSGAPKGKRNGAYRHGTRTKEAMEANRTYRAWLKMARSGVRDGDR